MANTRKPNGDSSIYQGSDGRWHGRVTVGVKDDGTPDRRHFSAKTRAEVTAKVRKLEKLRDNGTVPKAGQKWTVGKWLTHWIKEIVPGTVSENTYARYEVAVRVLLIPGLGAHRLEKLEPEHLERFLKEDAGCRQRCWYRSPGPPHNPCGPRRGSAARPPHP